MSAASAARSEMVLRIIARLRDRLAVVRWWIVRRQRSVRWLTFTADRQGDNALRSAYSCALTVRSARRISQFAGSIEGLSASMW
jgi:hypothetical protein